MIYVLEDDESISKLEKYALESYGYQVDIFESAESFFQALEKNIPELIILDVMLPDMDGIEILKKIRNTSYSKSIPVIMVTPKSNTILPSITRRSLLYVAKEYLGMEVEEREVFLEEVKDFAECGLCGTAAVISPVGKIVDHGTEICLPSGMDEMGPVLKKLYDTLTGIQMGRIEAPEGWIRVIK